MCTVYYNNSVFITNTATQIMHSYGTCRQCAYVESYIIILGITTPALCEGGDLQGWMLANLFFGLLLAAVLAGMVVSLGRLWGGEGINENDDNCSLFSRIITATHYLTLF